MAAMVAAARLVGDGPAGWSDEAEARAALMGLRRVGARPISTWQAGGAGGLRWEELDAGFDQVTIRPADAHRESSGEGAMASNKGTAGPWNSGLRRAEGAAGTITPTCNHPGTSGAARWDASIRATWPSPTLALASLPRRLRSPALRPPGHPGVLLLRVDAIPGPSGSSAPS